MQGNALPKCSNSGTASLSVVLLKLGVPTYGFYDRSRIRRGQRCDWGPSAMLESFSFSPNIRTEYASGRRMIKPSLILLCIYPRDEIGNLWGAGRGVGPLGDGGLQLLRRSQGSSMGGDYIIFIQTYEGYVWMPNPLRKDSQCLPLLGGKEKHKGWIAKDFPGSCLGHSCQVICRS